MFPMLLSLPVHFALQKTAGDEGCNTQFILHGVIRPGLAQYCAKVGTHFLKSHNKAVYINRKLI